MFGDHFYHATMRKSVAVFGTLFNDIKVIRKGANGAVLNQVKVPLAYGPKQKFLARLDQETGFDAPMAIKLPRMAFEMTSLDLDTNIKQQKRNKIVEDHASDVSKKKTIAHYTSYNIGMSLYILAKNQDDGLQIVEQILPYFQPEYTVSITPVDNFTHKQDVPVVLTGVSIQDDYEGDFTERRVLTYQLDFVMKMKFYGPTQDQGIIRTINLDFKQQTPAEFFQGLNFAVASTDSPSSFTVTTTRDTTQNPTTSGNTFTYNAGVQGISISKKIIQAANQDEIFVDNVINLGVGMGVSGYGLPSGLTIDGIETNGLFISVTQNVNTTPSYPDLTFTGNKYFIFDQQQPTLNFNIGNTYIINYPAGHPFKFSQVPNGTHNGGVAYTAGVTNPTSTSIQIVVDSNTPSTLYYYCSQHSAMGGQINIS
jgi:hypothetical protein